MLIRNARKTRCFIAVWGGRLSFTVVASQKCMSRNTCSHERACVSCMYVSSQLSPRTTRMGLPVPCQHLQWTLQSQVHHAWAQLSEDNSTSQECLSDEKSHRPLEANIWRTWPDSGRIPKPWIRCCFTPPSVRNLQGHFSVIYLMFPSSVFGKI